MNKIERVTAVMEGRRPDRPPVSFWYHFPPEAAAGPAALEAHVRHAETYDLDFLKIMDDNRYPRSGVMASPRDLDRLAVLRGDEDTFGRQLELIGALAKRFAGELLMTTTVFSPWSALRQMTAPDTGIHGPPVLDETADPRDAIMSRLLHEAPKAFERGMGVIAESLANFTKLCLQAGANGIYLSVRDDWVDTRANEPGTYDRSARPGDLAVIRAAAKGTFNILHVCGKAIDFRRFAGYPVQVINWADRSAGPPIAEVAGWVRPAICAGVDNLGTLVTGSPADCTRQVADALAQAGPRPIMISPGCTFDPEQVPKQNLHAMRKAVENAHP